MSEPITEQIGDQFGITVRYEPHEAHVDFFAYEVLAVSEGGQKWYWRKGSDSSVDNTDQLHEAEYYLQGSVKWDGCSHLNFGDEGYLHLCGREQFEKLTHTLLIIYERCGALMAADRHNTRRPIRDAVHKINPLSLAHSHLCRSS